jgi:hypothetical protein
MGTGDNRKKLGELSGRDDTGSRRTPVEEVACLSRAEFTHVEPIMDGGRGELPPDGGDGS